MDEHSNDDLKKRLLEGTESAFREIFIFYYPVLTVFANKFLHDEHAAKDAVQTIFIKMFTGRRTEIRDLKSYLFGAVHNECLNVLRLKKRLTLYQQQYATHAEGTIEFHDALQQSEAETRIYRAIEQLPPQCRKVFIMSRLEEKKNAVIATELGLSVRTVETQISNALKILRKALFSIALLLQ